MQSKTEWMTSKHAARKWHVSERTARRYFNELGAPIMKIADDSGKLRLRRVLPIDTKPPYKLAGNPGFLKTSYQRALAGRRWDGHITPQLRKGIQDYFRWLDCKRMTDGIELGMPPERDDDDE